MSARSTGESTAAYTDSRSASTLDCDGSDASGVSTRATGICWLNGNVPAAVPAGIVPRTNGVSTSFGSRLMATTVSVSVNGALVTTDPWTSAVPVYGMATKSAGRPASVKSVWGEKTHWDCPLASNCGHVGD